METHHYKDNLSYYDITYYYDSLIFNIRDKNLSNEDDVEYIIIDNYKDIYDAMVFIFCHHLYKYSTINKNYSFPISVQYNGNSMFNCNYIAFYDTDQFKKYNIDEKTHAHVIKVDISDAPNIPYTMTFKTNEDGILTHTFNANIPSSYIYVWLIANVKIYEKHFSFGHEFFNRLIRKNYNANIDSIFSVEIMFMNTK